MEERKFVQVSGGVSISTSQGEEPYKETGSVLSGSPDPFVAEIQSSAALDHDQ